VASARDFFLRAIEWHTQRRRRGSSGRPPAEDRRRCSFHAQKQTLLILATRVAWMRKPSREYYGSLLHNFFSAASKASLVVYCCAGVDIGLIESSYVVPCVRDMGLTKNGAFHKLAFKRSQQAVEKNDENFDVF